MSDFIHYWTERIERIDSYIFFLVDIECGDNPIVWKFDFSDLRIKEVLEFFNTNSLNEFLLKYSDKVKLDYHAEIKHKGKDKCYISYEFRIIFKDHNRVEIYCECIRDIWHVFGYSGLAKEFLESDWDTEYLEEIKKNLR